MARKAAAPGRTPTTLYASVNEWLGRLGAATTPLRNGAASLPFWLSWASDVLVCHGVDPSWRSVSLADIVGLKGGSAPVVGRSQALARVAAFRDAAAEGSPQWHAATLYLAAMNIPVASALGEGNAATEAAAMVVGRMLVQIEEERLQPDAEMGRGLRQRNRSAGLAGVKERRRNAEKEQARIRGAVARYRRSNPDASRRLISRDLAGLLRLGPEALLSRLRRLGL
jgi:hypothetical protein